MEPILLMKMKKRIEGMNMNEEGIEGKSKDKDKEAKQRVKL